MRPSWPPPITPSVALLNQARKRGVALVLITGRKEVVGRPMLYGLSAGGEAGARHALKILLAEIDRVLALTGTRSIAELNPDLLWHPDFIPVRKS